MNVLRASVDGVGGPGKKTWETVKVQRAKKKKNASVTSTELFADRNRGGNDDERESLQTK